jgi:apolipoprotein N-acyltransferase
MYSKEGQSESVYVKRGLTPFGEFMPLRKIAEFVNPMAKTVVDFIPGKDVVTHQINGARLGPIICYEIIVDSLVREMAGSSEALVVQTNSATFANTAESAQQLAITRIRAVEHSRAILSVSTVGISAFIDNNGRVVSQTLENKRAFLLGNLTLSRHRTPIDRIAQWIR